MNCSTASCSSMGYQTCSVSTQSVSVRMWSRSSRPDLALEEKALRDLREGIAYCEGVRDFVSRDLLLKILGREEEHVDFLERQFDLIKQIGIERYVMLNADAASEHDG